MQATETTETAHRETVHVGSVPGDRFHVSPVVAVDPDGVSWVAWIKTGPDGDRLLLKRAGDPEPRVVTTARYVLRPAIAADAGGIWLSWPEGSANGWTLSAVRIAGGAIGPRRPLVADAAARAVNPALTVTGDGAVWAVWEEHRPDGCRIRRCRLDATSPVTAEVVSGEQQWCYDPTIASDTGGRMQIAWTAFADGEYVIQGCAGLVDGLLGPVELLARGSGPCQYPALATVDQTAWLAYVAYQAEWGLLSWQSFSFVQHPRRQRQLASFSKQRLVYVVQLGQGTGAVPEAKGLPESLQRSGIVAPALGGARPALAADGAGNLQLFWYHYVTGSRPSVHAARLTTAGWQEAPVLQESAGDAGPLSVARLPSGRLAVALSHDPRGAGGFQRGAFQDHQSVLSIRLTQLPLVDQPVSATTIPVHALPPHTWYRPSSRNPAPPVSTLTDAGTTYQLVFGNLHIHTDRSSCMRAADGEPELNWRHAREVMGDGFAAVTDHCFNSDALVQQENLKYCALYHWPGHFVTIPSYEWTGSHSAQLYGKGPFGHLNVHWFGEEGGPTVYSPSAADNPGNTSPDLWERLRGQPVLTLPHHPANRNHPYPWGYVDPDLMPVVEIFQDYRGSAEWRGCPGSTGFPEIEEPGHYVNDALHRGLRLGFIGSGDHVGVGQTGLYVTALTRAALYEALQARRCFGTSGLQCLLDFRVNGVLMGGAVESADGEVVVVVRVSAPVAVQRITLVVNGQEVAEYQGDGRTAGWQLRLNVRPPSGLTAAWIYPRIAFENGELAWASPVWVALSA
ncbi:MAG: hypothetical protein M1118_12795 [Chloroflexi bacterium]|nr:hypothetical protein [Chloroflexota bacterium]